MNTPDTRFRNFTENESSSRLIQLETKGDHLDNLDTAYKRELLSERQAKLSTYFNESPRPVIGSLIPNGTPTKLQKVDVGVDQNF